VGGFLDFGMGPWYTSNLVYVERVGRVLMSRSRMEAPGTRSLATSVLFLAIICPVALAANDPISGLDPVLYSESGWQWGTFNEEVSTISFSDDSNHQDRTDAKRCHIRT